LAREWIVAGCAFAGDINASHGDTSPQVQALATGASEGSNRSVSAERM